MGRLRKYDERNAVERNERSAWRLPLFESVRTNFNNEHSHASF